MKVLFISHYDNMYGANRALLSLILGMQESGVHQPFVTLPAEGEFTEALRKEVRDDLAEMRRLYEKGWTPKVKPSKACNACSLKPLCLPKLMKARSVSAYLSAAMEETT